MDRRATVRVKEVDNEGSALNEDRIDCATRMLSERGFAILRVGRRGVSIEADESAFAREFGISAETKGSVVKRPPAGSALSEVIDLVEIAEKPTPFRSLLPS